MQRDLELGFTMLLLILELSVYQALKASFTHDTTQRDRVLLDMQVSARKLQVFLHHQASERVAINTLNSEKSSVCLGLNIRQNVIR